jgi:UDP:flavonoid glycosyltransferase YjiC (YdhE family)
LLTGWGGLQQSDLPDHIFKLEAAPHDWLFPRMTAVVHHGGAGTTAAGLRAGVPNIVVPFFLDQPFWGHRVKTLKVGPAPIPHKQLSIERLTNVIQLAVNDAAMHQQAAELGERIRAEDGVKAAIDLINSSFSE